MNNRIICKPLEKNKGKDFVLGGKNQKIMYTI